jgi:hypothetical protein
MCTTNSSQQQCSCTYVYIYIYTHTHTHHNSICCCLVQSLFNVMKSLRGQQSTMTYIVEFTALPESRGLSCLQVAYMYPHVVMTRVQIGWTLHTDLKENTLPSYYVNSYTVTRVPEHAEHVFNGHTFTPRHTHRHAKSILHHVPGSS